MRSASRAVGLFGIRNLTSILLWIAFAIYVFDVADAGNVEGVDDSILFKMRWKPPLPSLDPLPEKFQVRINECFNLLLLVFFFNIKIIIYFAFPGSRHGTHDERGQGTVRVLRATNSSGESE